MVLLTFLLILSEVGAIEQPQQVHLSLGADPAEMVVTWVTMHTSPLPSVEVGIDELSKSFRAKTTRFVDGGSEKRQMYIHRAVLKKLKPDLKYQYRCGDSGVWSKTFTFKTMPKGNDWSPRLAIYGDLGVKNGRSVPQLRQDVKNGLYDAILHVGDLAYNMNSDNARVGDKFMRIIEPIAAYVPYQVCPGNHEQKYNFSNYDNKFSMIDTRSGQINNHFYSFNIGTAHIISISTEFYYYMKYGWDQIRTQYEWLEEDLMEANKPENRAQRPWIILMAHKPMYCSTGDKLCSSIDGTAYQRKRLRKGIRVKGNPKRMYGLEGLLLKYEVDIQFYGHEHNYQRLFPVYDNRVFNGTLSNPYHNPTKPIVIITGSAGCYEEIRNFKKSIPVWSAFRNSDYGFSRMTIHNKTHITVEQVSADQAGRVIDRIKIIKDKRNFNYDDNEVNDYDYNYDSAYDNNFELTS